MAAATAAFARQVEVTWQMRGDETLEQGKQRATQMGWTEAAFRESLELLPGALSPERQELLRQFLATRAPQLVRASRETSLSERVDGMRLGLEVEVDVPGLRQLLQRSGVFFTVAAMQPYSLVLSQAPETAAQEIQRLELLCGLQQQEGATPHLQLNHDGTTWRGVIQAGEKRYDLAGSDLETLWFSLWGWFFSAHGFGGSPPDQGGASGTLEEMELVVEGWPSPDGVYAFEHVLAGFRPVLATATLKTLNMRADGVVGVWKVGVRDPHGFKGRLEAYMQGRGLVWHLEGGSQGAVSSASGRSTENPAAGVSESVEHAGPEYAPTKEPRESSPEIPKEAPQAPAPYANEVVSPPSVATPPSGSGQKAEESAPPLNMSPESEEKNEESSRNEPVVSEPARPWNGGEWQSSVPINASESREKTEVH